jgi:hypothetical protein
MKPRGGCPGRALKDSEGASSSFSNGCPALREPFAATARFLREYQLLKSSVLSEPCLESKDLTRRVADVENVIEVEA